MAETYRADVVVAGGGLAAVVAGLVLGLWLSPVSSAADASASRRLESSSGRAVSSSIRMR